MTIVRNDQPVEPGFEFAQLNIDTSPQGKAKRRAQPRGAAEPVADDPLSMLYATPKPPPEPGAGWGSRLRTFVIGKGASFCFWQIALPGVLNIGTISSLVFGAGALLATWGGYKLHKAPDTDQGRAVVRAVGDPPKPGLAARIIDPVKDAAAKPVAVVRDGAKKAVDKAGAKADELRDEMKEQANLLGDALREGKPATGEAPPSGPETPGIIDKVKGKLTDARDAVAEKVQSLAGPAMTPEQARKVQAARNAYLRNQKIRAQRIANQQVLGQMGAALNAQAQMLANEAAMQEQQRLNWAGQMMQQQAQQANAAIG